MMNTRKLTAGVMAGLLLGTLMGASLATVAQGNSHHQRNQGQNKDWVRAGNGDFATHYSSKQMDRDRRSKDAADQARVRIYNQKSFMHNGHRYIRHSRRTNGVLSFFFSIG